MNPEIMIFVLLGAGLLLLALEFFVPSGGMIAVLCVGCLAGSAWYAYKAWYLSHPSYWWGYVGSLLVMVPIVIVGTFQLIARTSLGNRVLLNAPSEEEVTPYQKERLHLESLIGKRGQSLGLMTPGGMVRIGSERLHAVSDGLMIDPNTDVEIIAVRGNRVVVRPVEAIAAEADAEDHTDITAPEPIENVDPFADDEIA